MKYIIEAIMSLYNWVITINPDLPTFIIMFGLPILIMMWIESIDWKKARSLSKVVFRYSLVLSANLLRTMRMNIGNYIVNFRQYKQVLQRRISEL